MSFESFARWDFAVHLNQHIHELAGQNFGEAYRR